MVIKKYNKRQSHFVKEERVEEPPVKDSSSLKLILSFFYPTDDEILQSSQQTDRSSMKPWWIAFMSRNINSLIQKEQKHLKPERNDSHSVFFVTSYKKKKKSSLWPSKTGKESVKDKLCKKGQTHPSRWLCALQCQGERWDSLASTPPPPSR